VSGPGPSRRDRPGWLPRLLVGVLVAARFRKRTGGQEKQGERTAEKAPAGTGTEASGHHGDRADGSLQGLVGQVIGSASFLAAALAYTGWAYEQAYLAPFNVSALSVSTSIPQYVLKSLNVFFTPDVVLGAAAVAVVAGISVHLARRFSAAGGPEGSGLRRGLLTGGATALILTLAWLGQESPVWYYHSLGVYYAVLGLLGVFLLLLTWPGTGGRPQFPFVAAIVIAAACFLWVAGERAATLGKADAGAFYHSGQTGATVYSAQPLMLSGNGVSCGAVPGAPATAAYRYRCTGLDLLYNETGTAYYLVASRPPRAGGQNQTYVISDSAQVMVELYARPG
jgi:hypothetical protein